MHNIKATNVPLTVNNDTCTTHVTSTGDHADVTSVKFNKISDFVLLKVKTDCVISADKRVGIPDGPSVMGDDVWYTARPYSKTLHLEKLVACLLRGDTVNRETALDVVQEAKVLARLLDRYDICTGNIRLALQVERKSYNMPWKPVGYVVSVLTFPSTLISRCATIKVTSRPVKAYLRRLRRNMVRGRDSRSLWGPGEGRGAYTDGQVMIRKSFW